MRNLERVKRANFTFSQKIEKIEIFEKKNQKKRKKDVILGFFPFFLHFFVT